MAESLNILVRAKVDNSPSQIESIDQQIEALSSKIKKTITVRLNIDDKDIQLLSQKVDKVNKEIEAKNKNIKPAQVFNKAELDKQGKEYIEGYSKTLNTLEQKIKSTVSNLSQINSVQATSFDKGKISSFQAEVTKTNGEIEKLKYSLQNISGAKGNLGYVLDSKTIKQGQIPILPETKTAVSNADKGNEYSLFQQKISQVTSDLKKNGAEINNVFESVNTKTGLITKATVQYTDNLGKAKTQAYELKRVYDTLKDDEGKVIGKQLKSVDLVPTTTNYTNNIGQSQSINFANVKSELATIQKLSIERNKLDTQDSEYYKLLNTQIAEHQAKLNNILNTKIKISETEQANSINAKQSAEIDNIKKKNAEELARIQAQNADASARIVSSTTSGRSLLGDKVSNISSVNINATSQELKKYAEAIGGVGSEYTKVIPKVDVAGNKFKELHVRIQEGDKWHNYIGNIDEATNSLYKIDRGLSDVTNRQLTVFDKLKVAFTSFPKHKWGIVV